MSAKLHLLTANRSWLETRLGHRHSGRLLSCVIAAGMICGFFLGDGWSRLPGLATHRSDLHTTSRERIEISQSQSASGTETIPSPLSGPSPDGRSEMHAGGPSSPLSLPQTVDTEVSPDPIAAPETERTEPSGQIELVQSLADLVPVPEQPELHPSDSAAEHQTQHTVSPVRVPDRFLVHAAQRQVPEKPSRHDVQQQVRSIATYTVQMGAFRDAANAHKAVSEFRTQGYQTHIRVWRDAKNQIWHRVCSQQFTDKIQAQTAARAINNRTNINAYVLQTPM